MIGFLRKSTATTRWPRHFRFLNIFPRDTLEKALSLRAGFCDLGPFSVAWCSYLNVMVGFFCLAQNLQISFNIFPVIKSAIWAAFLYTFTSPTPKDWSGSTKLFYKRSHPRHNIKYCDIVAANPRKPVQLRRYLNYGSRGPAILAFGRRAS